MKSFRIAQSTALMLALFSVSQFALAQPANGPDTQNTLPPPPPCGAHGPGKSADFKAKHAEMRQTFANELNLNQEQQTKIEAIHQQFLNAHKAEFDAHKAQFDEICKLMQSGASKAEIDAKRQALKPDFKKTDAERHQLDEKIKAVLTPEQIQKFEAFQEKHKPPFGNGQRPPAPPEE
jgi:Spy/CpxP family protein refolding chaperone